MRTLNEFRTTLTSLLDNETDRFKEGMEVFFDFHGDTTLSEVAEAAHRSALDGIRDKWVMAGRKNNTAALRHGVCIQLELPLRTLAQLERDGFL